MGFVIGIIIAGKGTGSKMLSIRTFLGSIAGILVMVVGYTVAGAIMNGSIYTGLMQTPGLSLEGILGMAVFYVIGLFLEREKHNVI